MDSAPGGPGVDLVENSPTPLPRAPVPSLDHTMKRYLEYASVLATRQGPSQNNVEQGERVCIESIEEVRQAVEEFFPLARGLQKRLEAIAREEGCWVNRFWLPEMYLKQRYSLVWNSNPAYIFPRQHFTVEKEQLGYAARLVYGIMQFKERIDRDLLPQEVTRGVPMCMNQYRGLLSSYREPHLESDIQHQKEEDSGDCGGTATVSEHILVMFRNQCFIAYVRWGGELLPPQTILTQLERIFEVGANRHAAVVASVGVVTAGRRDTAAKFWELAAAVGDKNRQSLGLIKNSVFTLCLDEGGMGCREEEEEEDGASAPTTRLNPLNSDPLSQRESDGLQLLHGFGSSHTGFNRWFDSTIQLVVGRSGCCGLCVEHSVAEGIVIIRMMESAFKTAEAMAATMGVGNGLPVGNGPGLRLLSLASLKPKQLTWVLSEEMLTLLAEARVELDRLSKDAQLAVVDFADYGKETIKGWKLSPDGFIQLAMQLAHYRLHGYTVSTYESATLRRFHLGRVDNIRAATPEALQWVKTMIDPCAPVREKVGFLKIAADKQAEVTRENVSGHGIDNHLCALEVLSRTSNPSPLLFTQSIWRELMRFPLSTSQVSVNECEAKAGSYLCYGPVVEDGYGCAYGIYAEKVVFAASAYKSNKRTNLSRFKIELVRAMRDMRAICNWEQSH